MDCKTALAAILDSVDYTAGNCRPNELVGTVLPEELIVIARRAIAESDRNIGTCAICGEPASAHHVEDGGHEYRA